MLLPNEVLAEEPGAMFPGRATPELRISILQEILADRPELQPLYGGTVDQLSQLVGTIEYNLVAIRDTILGIANGNGVPVTERMVLLYLTALMTHERRHMVQTEDQFEDLQILRTIEATRSAEAFGVHDENVYHNLCHEVDANMAALMAMRGI